ncbi:15526_t:CDS:2, partial [Entrophospora sp. SA101]
TNLSEIRGILKKVSFGDQYNFEKDHDVDYIIFAIHALKNGDWVLRSITNGDKDEFGMGETIVKETLNTQSKNCDQTSFVDAGLKRKHSQNQEQLPICMTSPRNIY